MKSAFARCLVFAAVIGIVGVAHAAPKRTPTPVPESDPEAAADESPVDYEDLPPGFFRLDEWIPPGLRDGLRAYEEGRYFTAFGSVDEILAKREPEYAVDDAQFLRGLVMVALGWDDLAIPALTAVAESRPPGPYAVLALLELVEIHARAERWKAIADLWSRAIDRPIRDGGSRGKQIQELLWEFGELRSATFDSTRREKKFLAAPEELEVLLEKRRERASDRLYYRCGQALLRLERHEDSIRALLAIGIESPYYPYARYSIAQNQFALGQRDVSWRTLVRLGRYPKITPEEKLLGSRARVMQAAMRFEEGETEKGIRIARAIPDDDPEAPRARLLLTNALLDAGQPALALAYGRDEIPTLPEEGARRALTLGAAYSAIGDKDAAAKVYRAAAETLRKERGADDVARLRGLAEQGMRQRAAQAQSERRHVADGMRVVLAHDGPWNLGTLLRRLRAVLGAGEYRLLSRGTKISAVKPIATEDPWVAYLESSRRIGIELALDRLAELDAKASANERAFRVLNAYLLALERSPGDEKERRVAARRAATLVNTLRTESKLEIPALRLTRSGSVALEAASYRRRLAQSGRAIGSKRTSVAPSAAEREEAASLLREWADRELAELLRERNEKLRELEFELEVALSGNIVGAVPGAAKSEDAP